MLLGSIIICEQGTRKRDDGQVHISMVDMRIAYVDTSISLPFRECVRGLMFGASRADVRPSPAPAAAVALPVAAVVEQRPSIAFGDASTCIS